MTGKQAASDASGSGYSIPYAWRAAGVVALVCALSWRTRHIQVDDALIYARYIRNALDGLGLVFNPGEHVNALTSILDSWITLAAAWLLRGRVLLAEALVSGTFLAAAALLAEVVVPLSGLAVASMSFFYLCKGMETSLFLFLLLVCVLTFSRPRHLGWLPLLCTLVVLTRFEGAALVAIIAYHLIRGRRIPPLLSFLPALLLVALYLAFNLSQYHELLPHSAGAKLGQGRAGFWGEWPWAFTNIPDVSLHPIGSSFFYFAVLIVFAYFARKQPRLHPWNRVVFPFLFLLTGFYILFNIPHYHWYDGPFLFFLTIYTVALVPRTREAYVAAVFLVLVLAKASWGDLHAMDKTPNPYQAAGEWLASNTPASARVASVETGYIGWYSHRYLIDILGLTTPQNAVYTAHRDFTSWFAERPDYIVVHPGSPFPWEKVALASPEYQLLPMHFNGVQLLRKK